MGIVVLQQTLAHIACRDTNNRIFACFISGRAPKQFRTNHPLLQRVDIAGNRLLHDVTGPNALAFNDPGNPVGNVMPTPPRYVAAWHDDMPAMIRILIKVDDPNNKVKDGPWYEYVFRLK